MESSDSVENKKEVSGKKVCQTLVSKCFCAHQPLSFLVFLCCPLADPSRGTLGSSRLSMFGPGLDLSDFCSGFFATAMKETQSEVKRSRVCTLVHGQQGRA